MYKQKAAFFFYCVSPVHMGSGTALGAIDNPIQRERHTAHPTMLGSGLKGALRDHCAGEPWEDVVFGPKPGLRTGSEHAGALSLADANLVLFPVRSLRGAYVYATSPVALGRLHRLLTLLDAPPDWSVPTFPDANACLTASTDVFVDGHLVLEAFQFRRTEGDIAPIARWFASHALPTRAGFAFFRTKLESSLVVLHDDRFDHFVRHSTIVEPHVRIADETGTADDGGLFYTENLPPESLLVSLVMASDSRKNNGPGMDAGEVLQKLLGRVDGQLVQFGGDASTGRGQVVVRALRSQG
jgi:CRISPR-associated protein Cmr4